ARFAAPFVASRLARRLALLLARRPVLLLRLLLTLLLTLRLALLLTRVGRTIRVPARRRVGPLRRGTFRYIRHGGAL
ncbi:hypothetical protein, partial [Burkholderia sp. Ac-20353]|uniref:hypothetical protein n=1 Tax=Burkholderia sp. Ac-20353 TaxID=2703894 RepID=UPI00197C5430